MKLATLIKGTIPDFGLPEEMPKLPDQLYVERYKRLAGKVRNGDLDALVIYADRERSSNISYISGWDPRFEEALFVHVPGKPPTIITGPENTGFANSVGLKAETILYPPFGVAGSNRENTPALLEVFSSLGIRSEMKVGVVGGKYFSPSEASEPENWIDAPAFIVDVLRQAVNPGGQVINATALLTHSSDGLRSSSGQLPS